MLIYLITNLVNGKQYVGQTIRSLNTRWIEHCSPSRRRCKITNAIQKYGPDAFTIEIIEEAASLEELNNREMYWIEYYDTYKHGYNSTLGGDGTIGQKCSPETAEKRRQVWLGRKHTPETLKKMSISAKNRKKRAPFSIEGRKNMSEAKKGKPSNSKGKTWNQKPKN